MYLLILAMSLRLSSLLMVRAPGVSIFWRIQLIWSRLLMCMYSAPMLLQYTFSSLVYT